MKKETLFKWNPKLELIPAILSLLWMWRIYYLDHNGWGENMVFQLIPSLLLTTLFVSVMLPVWWIAWHKKEGLAGLGITTKKLGISLILGLCLAAWRGISLVSYVNSPAFVSTLLFNALCIWEVLFIYSWLYTRYENSFGKLPACILTAFSVGIYHTGSLAPQNIAYLMLCILICALCFAYTKNIFMLWPLYWASGTSSSTLKSGFSFGTDMIMLAAAVLLIQFIFILIIGIKCKKRRFV